MATASKPVTFQTQIVDHGSSYLDRLFYVIAACAMLFLTFVGFEQFYLHGRAFTGGQITTQIVPLVVAHGLAMSSWVVLLFVQSVLIVAGNRRIHMKIGVVGAVLAAVIVILGLSVATASVHFVPEAYKPFGGARFFLGIMLMEILTFGALVAVGIRYRRRPEIHRPMMLLATVVLMTGSLDRWPFIPRLMALTHDTVPIVQFGPMLLLGALFFLPQWGLTKATNRCYAVGYAGLVIACLFSLVLANSSFWDRVARIVVP